MEIYLRNIATALLLLSIAHGFILDFDEHDQLLKAKALIDPSESIGGTAKLFFQDHTPAGVLRVRAGEPFVLDCEAGGTPSPTIHFLRDGHRVLQGADNDLTDDEARYEDAELDSNNLRLSSTKARLVLPCVTSQHEGEYTCVAQTQYQRISTTTYIEVVEPEFGTHKNSRNHRRKHHRKHSESHSSGECLLKRLGDGSPARIHMWTSQRLEFEGSNVQLFCRTTGSPTPKITWYDRDGAKITSDQNDYKILGNGDLLIRSIGWMKNMGLYRCEAENGEGKDEVSTFLYPTAP